MVSHRYSTPVYALLLSASVLLSGCYRASVSNAIDSAEEVVAAKQDVDLLRARKFDGVKELCSPGVLGPHADYTLTRMADQFPDEQPISITTVGFSKQTGPGQITDVSLQYQFQSTWVLVSIRTQDLGEDRTWIEGFAVSKLGGPIREYNRFTFASAGMSQFVVLFLALASLSVSLYVCIVCLRTNLAKPKWLWLIGVWAGVGCISVNWTSGVADYHVIAINLPTALAVATPYGPWIISAFFPLGAVLFLWRKQDLEKRAMTSPPIIAGETPQIPSENSATHSTD